MSSIWFIVVVVVISVVLTLICIKAMFYIMSCRRQTLVRRREHRGPAWRS